MPYRAMIVEDNAIYRYAVKTIIDWRAHGFELAAEAINGKQALQVMDRESFDLILTDVSMPEMNGIDLIEAVKRRTPDTVVVMLSSFDDFQFVKDSLKLGAQDYLLKHDLEPESLAQLLDQVKARLEEAERLRGEREAKRAAAEAEFARRAMLGDWPDERELARQAEACGFRHGAAPYRILALACAEALAGDAAADERFREALERARAGASDGAQALTVRLSPGCWAVAVFAPDEALAQSAARSLAVRLPAEAAAAGLRASVGLSDARRGCAALPAAYAQADAALFQTAYDGWGRVYGASRPAEPGGLDPACARDWLAALRKGDPAAGEAATEALVGRLRRLRCDRAQLQQCLADGLSLAAVLAEERGAGEDAARAARDRQAALQQALRRMEPPERLFALILGEFAKLSPPSADAGARPCRKEIQQAIAYIREHYAEEITLPALADVLGFSPNYLSNLFRSETGMRLTEYVNRHRTDVAKRLLRETRLKVYEVAEKVGYPDASYFCKVFKEVAGQTVSEFRKSE
ncbi:response regulator [Cohnella sp. REN36]|uniref:response regulator n=1 Tax=Cohnella sp. REN36 TaxID=2887347 RepID=UPI001D14DB64|nr:response regulator [Cohnella sp. REN36]MCC3373974.1 response regulator [Cohnella sp. REN36]